MVSETENSVSKNVGVLSASRLVTAASSILLMLFLPRFLGPVGYGRLYLGQSIVGILGLLVEFGGANSIPKAVARHPEEAGHIVANSISIRVILWVVALMAMMGYAFLVEYPDEVKVIIFIFGIGLLWSMGSMVLFGSFQGFELMKYPSYSSMVYAVFVSLIGIVALLLGIGPVGFSIIMVTGGLLSLLTSARFLPRIIPSIPGTQWRQSFAMLKDGIPYFLNSVFSTIYYRIDSVMLSLMTPESVVGCYGASYRFFDSLMFVPNILTLAVFPVFSRLWGKDEPQLLRTMQKSLDFMMIIGIPISVGMFAFSREFIGIFYGLEGYTPSILTLQIFSVSMLIVYIDFILGSMVFATDRQRRMSLNSFIAIIVNVVLNYFLIPFSQLHYGNGGIGSAVATAVTEIFIMISMIFLLPKGFFARIRYGVVLKALVSGILMAGSVWCTDLLGVYWVLRGAVGSAVYILILFALRTFEPSDLEFVGNILPVRKIFGRKNG